MKFIIPLFCLCLLSACNFPLDLPPNATPNVTQAYGTIQAKIQTHQAETAAALKDPSTLPVVTVVPTTVLTYQTTPVSLPATLIPTMACDRMQPGVPLDVTIQDDSIIPPGEVFTKTWRLVNVGGCTWTTDYSIAWFSGEPLTDARIFPLEQVIPPGQTVDISIEMKAPLKAGTYQSNWKLQNDSGYQFGIGPNGYSPIWVRIIVPSVSSPTNTPTSSSPQVPSELVNGTAQLTEGKALNTSNLAFSDPQLADLLLQAGQLLAVNDARFSVSLGGIPDYGTCQAITKKDILIPVIPDNKYKYFCFIDNAANIGWIQILSDDPAKLDIEILTWAE